MAEREVSDIDLEQMTDQEIMDLIKAALERLNPARFSEVTQAVNEMRRAKEAEVKETLLAEFRQRAMQMGLSLTRCFGRAEPEAMRDSL